MTTRRPRGYASVTSNSEDFWAAEADKRNPHDDLADAFAADHSTYGLGVGGLEPCLRDEFGDYLDELIAEMYFPDDPRGLELARRWKGQGVSGASPHLRKPCLYKLEPASNGFPIGGSRAFR